jgi:uncharacterized protein YggU (UPF0235/DUF167 family)
MFSRANTAHKELTVYVCGTHYERELVNHKGGGYLHVEADYTRLYGKANDQGVITFLAQRAKEVSHG